MELQDSSSTATFSLSSGTGTLYNAGTFKRDSTPATNLTRLINVQVAYVDSGTTRVAQDTLTFSGGPSQFNGKVTYGPSAAGFATVLGITGGTDTIRASATFGHGGRLWVGGGLVVPGVLASDSIHLSTVSITAGNLQGVGQVVIDSLGNTIADTLFWSGGSRTGTGGAVTYVPARSFAIINPTAAVVLSGGNFTNAGTVIQRNSGHIGTAGVPAITNQAGATWDIQSAADIIINSGAATFSNAGLLEKTGTGLSQIGLATTNTGTLAITTDTLELLASGNSLGGTIEGTGMLKTSGTSPSFIGIVDPGATGSGSIGTLTIGPNFAPGASTVLQFDLTVTPSTPVPGVDYDQLVDSTGVANALANLTIKLNPVGANTFLDDLHDYVIIRCVTSCSLGGPLPTLDVSAIQALTGGGDIWQLTTLGNDIIVHVFATGPDPEPAPGMALAPIQLSAGTVSLMPNGVRVFLAGKSDEQRQRIFSQALGLVPPTP
jgi:hypothetical protein